MRLAIAWLAGALLLVACETPPPSKTTAAPAERIITLAPHLAELVFAAGAGERLVGVSAFTDYPPAVRSLPIVGDAFRVDYEAVAALAPDLILSWGSGNPAAMVERLRKLGYRVVSLEPRNLDGIARQLETIGELAGSSRIAARAAADYRQGLEELRQRHAGSAPLPVFYQVSAQPLLTVSRLHVIGQVLELCGGRNLFADLPDAVPAVALEAVIESAPAVIFASAPLAGSQPELDFWRKWTVVPAVRDGRIYIVDADLLSRPGLRLLDGARQLCGFMAQARSD
jgi:iron complex transport system substrate-binding protein